jgi:hypothetical protein
MRSVMDGSSVDFIVIPIVAVISLAAWLVVVYWADSHPAKSQRTATVTDEHDAVAAQTGRTPPVARGTVPRQPTAPADDEDLTPARQLTGSR